MRHPHAAVAVLEYNKRNRPWPELRGRRLRYTLDASIRDTGPGWAPWRTVRRAWPRDRAALAAAVSACAPASTWWSFQWW